jgi:hypothetical protein
VREVLLDGRALERRDVAGESVIAGHHTPRAELLRKLERGGVEALGDRLGRTSWVALHGQVEITQRPAEKRVPHGSTDDPPIGDRLSRRDHSRLGLQLLQAHASCR